MYLLIFRLLVRTRLSRSFLVFIALLAFIDLSVSFSGFSSGATSTSLFGSIFLLLIFYFILTMTTLFGSGLGMTKPDSDFLLPSSINGKMLNYALFTVQLISISLIFIILSVAYSIDLYHFTPDAVLSVVDFALLGFTLTAVSVLVSDLDLIYRALIFAAESVFLFSFLIGFQFSPFAILNGDLFMGTIGTLVLFAATMVPAIRWLNTNDLYVKAPRLAFRKKETYRDQIIFRGLSPGAAIFRNYFTHFFTGRPLGMSGTVLAVSNRFRVKAVFAVMVALSSAFVLGVYYVKPPNATDLFPFLIIIIIYLSFTLDLILYGTSFSVERIWLSAMSMPFHSYVQKMVSSQVIQAAVLEIPLGAAVVVLSFMYGFILLPVLIAVLVITPEAVAVMSSLSIVAKPPQTWENAIMVRRVGIKRIIYVLPYSVIIMSGVLLSILSPIAAGAEAVFVGALILIFLTRRRYWEGMVSKLVESTYI